MKGSSSKISLNRLPPNVTQVYAGRWSILLTLPSAYLARLIRTRLQSFIIWNQHGMISIRNPILKKKKQTEKSVQGS